MSLPKWVPPKDHAHILDDGQVRNLIEALTIAVEALEYYQKGKRGSHSTMPAEEALRRIEALGK